MAHLLAISARARLIGHPVVHLGSRKPECETARDVRPPFHDNNMSSSMYTKPKQIGCFPNT
jgi:hypothetical protein